MENILKTVVPRLEIKTNYSVYRLVSGTGLRTNLIEQKILFKNYITKRKVKKECLKLENISPATYKAQYDDLVELIEKKCVGILPVTETLYDYAIRLTKKLEPTEKKKKVKKVKAIDEIEG